jgi:hypothetical protein
MAFHLPSRRANLLLSVEYTTLRGNSMIRKTLLLVLAAAISVPAVAGNPAAPAQPGAKADNPDDKIVCRFVNTTGSRLSRDKECKTRAQWNRESDDARDDIEHQAHRATGEATNGSH